MMTLKFKDLPKYSYETHEICLINAGKKIYGEAKIPLDGATKHPLIIFSHGYGASYISNHYYFDDLVSRGIAIYTFDFCGGGNNSKSDGKTTDMSIMTEVSDLETVLKNAQSWDWVDRDRIALFGHSQGGFVSAITAARHPNDIHSMILMAPGFSIPDLVRDNLKLEDPNKTEFEWYEMTLGMTFVNDIVHYDSFSEIANFTRKVLIIHGTEDKLVPIKYSHKAIQIYQDVEYHEIDKGSHKLKGDHYNLAIDYIAAFIQKSGLLQLNL